MALTENSINYLHDFLENKYKVRQVGETFSLICEALILSDFQDDNIENNKIADIILLSNSMRSAENLKDKFLEIAEMMNFEVISLRKDCLIVNKTFYFFYSITKGDDILRGRTNTICFLDNSIPSYKCFDIEKQNPHIDIRTY